VEKPTARTTWFSPMALAVSVAGVTARMAWGMAAEKPPTPSPSTAMAVTDPARLPRAAANTAKATTTMPPLPASSWKGLMRPPSRGTIRPARKPRAENGTSTRPAWKVDSP
jgi:hypothetical protein